MDAATKFALNVSEAAQHQRAARLLIAEGAKELELADRKRAQQGSRFSIVRAVRCMANDGLRDGLEREICEEAARQSGGSFDPHRITVPWSVLGRAMIVGTASSGGYLVAGDPVGPAQQALFSYSSVIRLGANLAENLRGDLNFPRIGTNAAAGWLVETGTATANAPVLAQTACSPKTVGGYVEFSRSLLVQSEAERAVGNHLLGVVGAEIDKSILAGTSTDSSQPLGIRYVTGVTVSTGTSYTNTTTHALLKTIGDGNARDDRVAFLGAPTTRQTLGARAENGTGSRFIWAGTDIAGHPAYVSSSVGTNTLFVGDYTNVTLLSWGVGPTIELNPYANFQAAIVGMRVFASVDVAVVAPGAFAVSVGIT